ncbi:MAG: quinoprotein glucose dehydrogenase [Sphingomonas bacterium]|nr:quinoprotein glucose dehydrogenase [Sphingomonas bacterium]
MTSLKPGVQARWPHIVFALLMAPVGLFLTIGGAWLIVLGGSIYYLATGLACLVSAVLIYRANRAGILVYSAMLAWTLLWSFYDVGWDFWGVFPRIAGPAILGLWLLAPSILRPSSPAAGEPRPSGKVRRVLTAVGVVLALIVVGFVVRGSLPQAPASDGHRPTAVVATLPPGLVAPAGAVPANPIPGSADWVQWGRTDDGARFAPFDQITPANVSGLKVAWTYRTGGAGPNEAVPLQINDTLYLCTRDNVIVALDAETGALRWQYNPVLTARANGAGCRGVSFHRQAAAVADQPCAARVITSTRDARLIAVDARDGQPCAGFGVNGVVDLRKGMGDDQYGYQYNTSPALVVGDVLVVGAGVFDGQSVGEPSGVVRGYDAVTGAFRWAWDMGRPGVNTEPPPGGEYTRGTPNVWSVMSADAKLGLIYLPMGNATPDFYGAGRSKEMEQYASSIVALRVGDGSVAWHFQTVHHDLWDYDAPAQPVLADFPTPAGPVPAVILPTKRGEFFVFDRATGRPLTKVEERATPQGGVKGDFTSPTQPFAVGMPSVAGQVLRESDMWGLTPMDQLVCRIRF